MKKISLIFALLLLGGCAETGRLLGEITMLPVRVAKGAVNTVTNYNEDQTQDLGTYDIEEVPLNHSSY